MKRVFIATTSFGEFDDDPINRLLLNGFEVIQNKTGKKLNNDEMIDSLSNCVGVIAGTENYSKKVLANLNTLKVISRLGVGIDNINLDYVKTQKIKLYTTKVHPKLAVAELILGLMIDLLRKISLQNFLLKSGKWNKTMGNILSGKSLGIIGYGNIGKELISLSSGFNLNYLVHDPIINDKETLNDKINFCDFNFLIKNSDIISINANLTEQNKGLFNYRIFQNMKNNSIIINTSRGEIIDEESLIKALENNEISGAGLDVFNEEPYVGPLVKFPNVVTTPHIGSYAKETRIAMENEAVDNLLSYFIKK
ncbi:MAG: hypothetical protein CMG74_10410 [Candidatus Marinimicrobia bacterium]|nr:hypothetical protein [Candidatus Neomarinimicrobiota bacterium]|tara:strand:- start:7819 stop:8745 length:927 start_codon:yes stop_codon:yes gene_type:complete